MKKWYPIFYLSFLVLACDSQVVVKYTHDNDTIGVGAEQFSLYLPLLKNKRVAVVGNQTSQINGKHLVDILLDSSINVVQVFAPEHGFRGEAANGAKIENGIDPETGLSIVSLYGKNKKPSDVMLEDVDVILFDIQDVGARFFTYISTMHYVMEAAAENHKKVIILDRPNPNGFYVDGPVLKKEYSSFVGMHPIPIVHGMTVGELATMINGEGWLNDKLVCDLTVIPCKNYSHSDLYKLPIAPSPNLPNMTAVYLYPSICLFESTLVSVGRGTDKPFQIIGYPNCKNAPYQFTPHKIPGVSEYPKYENIPCNGYDLSEFGDFYFTSGSGLYLGWLLGMYEGFPDKNNFFKKNNFFDKLAGTNQLKKQIIAGKSAEEIKESWQADLLEFKKKRKKYLLYKDFE